MTRKYIVAIREALRDARGAAMSLDVQHGVNLAAIAVSRAIAQHYPNFDRQRFLKDCGVFP